MSVAVTLLFIHILVIFWM